MLRFCCSGVHFARGLLCLDGIDSSSADFTTCSSIQSGNVAETASLSCPLAIRADPFSDVVLISWTPSVKTRCAQKIPEVHLHVHDPWQSVVIFDHLWASIITITMLPVDLCFNSSSWQVNLPPSLYGDGATDRFPAERVVVFFAGRHAAWGYQNPKKLLFTSN